MATRTDPSTAYLSSDTLKDRNLYPDRNLIMGWKKRKKLSHETQLAQSNLDLQCSRLWATKGFAVGTVGTMEQTTRSAECRVNRDQHTIQKEPVFS